MPENISVTFSGHLFRADLFRAVPCNNGFEIRLSCALGLFLSWHSQIRRTFQPASFRKRVTWTSRCLFLANFSLQSVALVCGVRLRPQLWPCQKQPSTKTATLALENIKSGLPSKLEPRRHPVIPADLISSISLCSVVLLPELRTRDIRADLDNPPKGVITNLPKHGMYRCSNSSAE